MNKATAVAPANIAFIKYWGKKDPAINLPFSNTLSMNLNSALTTTTVEFRKDLKTDEIFLNEKPADKKTIVRTSTHLDRIRTLGNTKLRARVDTSNSFPTAAGIASSASGFAALTVAAAGALGLSLSETELSRVARLGSGSASRSVPSGFVEWHAGTDDQSSFAESFAPVGHWDLVDIVAVVESGAKKVSSGEGHELAPTSPLFEARVLALPDRVARMKQAVLDKDLVSFGELLELEALDMHMTTFTAHPPMTYWNGGTIEVIHQLFSLRERGILAYFTLDAGANVHVLTTEQYRETTEKALREIPAVKSLIVNRPAQGAHLV